MLIIPIKPYLPSHQVNTIHQLLTLNELHHHFSHTREKQLHATLKALNIKAADSPLHACLICKKGKQTHKPIQYAVIYLLPNKSKVLTSFKHYLTTTPDRKRCWKL
ncbi:uncharacterized protein ACA1_374030 [Acanthamoeba castellanii str. Neff]|uniref:Uncharacterized protein n=1 Tax=Acanthamoeba castellanii (strain ATCC 30010 / Neff) TaxID=1257118 RepID=L8GJG8_ACACF|nr:uncharacterized protein ACA1_374030 [Acanthamoeba castellanii str. Neff]ELR12336.1 hypothetical protein ACA1_374030 [Acanthamoeba castellanii str. Neff]